MESLEQFLSFAAVWLGVMALIVLCLYITGKFFRKDEGKTVNAQEYAQKFEEEINELTPEKPIKKFFRNPYVLSSDEARETKDSTQV